MTLPILYSYRRCPYAMRARMALKYAGIAIEIREISLRDKPAHLLEVSPKATVPVLVLLDGAVLEQSLDIMHWALQQRDIDGWLLAHDEQAQQLIAENDTSFKQALDRYKYAIRFPEQAMEDYRSQGEAFLAKLEQRLTQTSFLAGKQMSLADIAIFPFIRQFSAVDADWFESTKYIKLKAWLSLMVESELFNSIMNKHPVYSDVEN
ncbi:MAG: glutathione S-transferase [Methylotenera sp.]|uniref:glutathione S-transferase n=1 Tax=Methylotenera sp. TaxID=2051956 RepID=UPI00271CBE2B|nr:glutathione S-transferase [Methylotenera sp.]MDO9151508.1 glutathione S-transferase [Methylotenera sp.]